MAASGRINLQTASREEMASLIRRQAQKLKELQNATALLSERDDRIASMEQQVALAKQEVSEAHASAAADRAAMQEQIQMLSQQLVSTEETMNQLLDAQQSAATGSGGGGPQGRTTRSGSASAVPSPTNQRAGSGRSGGTPLPGSFSVGGGNNDEVLKALDAVLAAKAARLESELEFLRSRAAGQQSSSGAEEGGVNGQSATSSTRAGLPGDAQQWALHDELRSVREQLTAALADAADAHAALARAEADRAALTARVRQLSRELTAIEWGTITQQPQKKFRGGRSAGAALVELGSDDDDDDVALDTPVRGATPRRASAVDLFFGASNEEGSTKAAGRPRSFSNTAGKTKKPIGSRFSSSLSSDDGTRSGKSSSSTSDDSDSAARWRTAATAATVGTAAAAGVAARSHAAAQSARVVVSGPAGAGSDHLHARGGGLRHTPPSGGGLSHPTFGSSGGGATLSKLRRRILELEAELLRRERQAADAALVAERSAEVAAAQLDALSGQVQALTAANDALTQRLDAFGRATSAASATRSPNDPAQVVTDSTARREHADGNHSVRSSSVVSAETLQRQLEQIGRLVQAVHRRDFGGSDVRDDDELL